MINRNKYLLMIAAMLFVVVFATVESIKIQNAIGAELSVEEVLEDISQVGYEGFSVEEDYLTVMKESCLSGDQVLGKEAEGKRNLKISTLQLDEKEISFDDLLLLSKIITAEAGSYWLPSDWKMMVGEVVLNRVGSPEFPDTIVEVIYQQGQYARVDTVWFSQLVPLEDCVDVAIRLLSGERIIDEPTVVFQSGSRQGSGVHAEMYDDHYGTTYFCYSSYPELYE